MKPYYFAAALALALCGCSHDKQAADAAEAAEELPLVELGAAYVQDVPQGKSYTATVEADNTNNIAPSAPNRIKTIAVEVGDHVAKGQKLVTLDDANLEQVRVNLENVEREYNRAAQLLEIGAGTQQAVDQLKAQLDALRTQYKNLQDNTVLLSPITGVVTARNYDPGDMTGGQPVLTVGQISPNVKVMINANESDFSKFSVGAPVSVAFDAYPGETFDGKISRIYPTVNPGTRTFQAEILVANPQGKILPGMFARVGIDFGTVSHVVVPDLAVVKQTGSGNRYVYVYSDGHVQMRRVELGQRLGNAYELISGVEDGEAVVVVGQARLADGVAVQVNK